MLTRERKGFPGGSDGKRIRLQYRRRGFDIWVGKIPWRIPMDRGDWQATAHGVAKSRTQLSDDAQEHKESKHCIYER